MPQPDPSVVTAVHATAVRRHQLPPTLYGAPFDRVVRAWREARDRRDARHGQLVAAVSALAVHARAHGVAVGEVLRALNAVIDPRLGGDAGLVWDSVREHAGQTAIASYYRDD